MTGALIVPWRGPLLGSHPVSRHSAIHDVIYRLLRFGCGAKYRAAIFLHRLQPSFDISSALVKFRLDPDLRAKHAVADFGHQLLERVCLAIIEPAQTVQPLCGSSPVGQLMRQGAVETATKRPPKRRKRITE
jgi:hypothetical protein